MPASNGASVQARVCSSPTPPGIGQPGAERDLRDLELGGSERAVGHAVVPCRWGRRRWRGYIAWAVGRTRILLSDTLRGRETANAMTSAMSSGRIDVEATKAFVPLRVSSWVMWLASSVATAPGSTTI